MVFGNREGVEVLEERDVLSQLPDRGTVLEQEMKVLREGNIAREKEILDLKITSDGYLSIRNRHLDVYQRDITGESNIPRQLTQERTAAAAHNGDAAATPFCTKSESG